MTNNNSKVLDKTQQFKPSTKKIMLDALNNEVFEENSIGRPEAPTLPLVGSMNVPISATEEKNDE